MNVAYDRKDLSEYIEMATSLSSEHPVVLSKFIVNAKEIEMDAVAMNGTLINYAISEHVENAGVHSGDATLILPPQKLYVETIKRVKRITKRIAKTLKISGPFNIQFLSKDNDVKVIECNMRASRSFPFVSKTYNVNFIDLATRIMIGKAVRPKLIDLADIDHVCIKAPMFSFTRLQGADPILRVEMASTGEVACFGMNKWEAFLKAMLSTGFKLPKNKNVVVSAGPLSSKIDFLDEARQLQNLGYHLYGTQGTAKFFNSNGVETKLLYKPSEKKEPQMVDYLKEGKIDMVINIPEAMGLEELTDGYRIRRTAVDFGVSLISNLKCAKLLVAALVWLKKNPEEFEVKCWQDYMAALVE
uniref:carbamoyl-phosphate synthase (ammonia) n=1 Tax=Lotharella oceanica TaxID=641309 RepID=A0A7S2TN06_9EUKA